MKKCKIYRLCKDDEVIMTIRATRLRIDKLENLNFGYFYGYDENICIADFHTIKEINPVPVKNYEDILEIHI